MQQKFSSLQQAQLMARDSIFRFVGTPEDKIQLQKMLKLLSQTKSGRLVVAEVEKLVLAQQLKKPVTLKMQKPNKKTLGWANANLEVILNRINLDNMTPHQKSCALLMQSIVLIHELVHICQFLKGQETYAKQFSEPAHLYADIVMELEATLKTNSFEIEAGKLWPKVTKDMNLFQSKPGWRNNLIRSFFNSSPYYQVPVWIDLFAEDLKKSSQVTLGDLAEKKVFSKWMDGYFQKMGIPFSCRDFPVEHSFGIKKQKDGVLRIKGDDSLMIFDKSGRVLVIGSGFEKNKESALKFMIFVSKKSTTDTKNWAYQMRREYPMSQISVIRGKQEKLFVNPFGNILKKSVDLSSR